MAWVRSEEEVDKIIEELMNKSTNKYITQSVLFNKQNPIHIELLKKTLMSSTSFGEFMRQLLAKEFNGVNAGNSNTNNDNNTHQHTNTSKRDMGNFF